MPEDEKKSPDLDKIVKDVTDEKKIDSISKLHTEAHHNIIKKQSKLKVSSWNEFLDEATKYIQANHKAVYKSELPPEMAQAQALQILDAAYEREGKSQAAYKLARKGKLAEVFNKLGETIEQDHLDMYEKAIFDRVDINDFASHKKIIGQIRTKYGSMFPKEFKSESDDALAHKWNGFVRGYVRNVLTATESFKKYEPVKTEKKAA